MKYLLSVLLFLVACVSFAGDFNAKTEAARLKASGQKIMLGKTTETGSFILCMESVEVQNGDLALAQESAKMQARVAIAEYMNVKVSSSLTDMEVSKETAQDEDSSFESVSFMQKCSKKEVSQMQRGVTVCFTEQSGSKLTVYCVLMENAIDATAKMEKAMKKMGPDTVQVSGIAYFGNGVSQSEAEKSALAEAQREAIAQVLGVSIASTTSRQTISKETMDNDGNETFECDDSFKARVFSSAAGFVESSRIIGKQVNPPTVTVTIVAKVAKDKLISDYRSYLEQMGNPGFCLRSNDRDMLDLYAGFFGELGLRMVDNLYDAAYIIDVTCKFMEEDGELKAAVRVVAKDKVNETILFSQENDPDAVTGSGTTEKAKIALCRKVLNAMKPTLHQKLNTFIGRANADGRKIQVKLCNYDSDYKAVAGIIEKALKMVPGASNVKMNIGSSEVVYTLNYKNETDDLADFLEKQIKVDVKRRSQRPERSKVSNTLVEFRFE